MRVDNTFCVENIKIAQTPAPNSSVPDSQDIDFTHKPASGTTPGTPGAQTQSDPTNSDPEIIKLTKEIEIYQKILDSYKSAFESALEQFKSIRQKSILPQFSPNNQSSGDPCSWASAFGGEESIFGQQDIQGAYKQLNDPNTGAATVYLQSLKKMQGMYERAYARETELFNASKNQPGANLDASGQLQTFPSIIEKLRVSYEDTLLKINTQQKLMQRYMAYLPYMTYFMQYMQELCPVYQKYEYYKDSLGAGGLGGVGVADLAQELRSGFEYGAELLSYMGEKIIPDLLSENTNTQAYANQFLIAANAMRLNARRFTNLALQTVINGSPGNMQ